MELTDPEFPRIEPALLADMRSEHGREIGLQVHVANVRKQPILSEILLEVLKAVFFPGLKARLALEVRTPREFITVGVNLTIPASPPVSSGTRSIPQIGQVALGSSEMTSGCMGHT